MPIKPNGSKRLTNRPTSSAASGKRAQSGWAPTLERLETRSMLAADLAASLTYQAGTYYPGQEIGGVKLNEVNVGDAPADDYRTRVFLSTNTTLGDADDIAVLDVMRADDELAAGAVVQSPRTIAVTSAVPSGRYYVLVRVDSDNDVTENVESNNLWVSASADVVIARGVVSVTATDQAASEANTNTGRVRFTRTEPLTAPLVVQYSVSGNATAGSDYQTLSGTITIPADQASAVVTIRPIDDSTVEGPERVVITITANDAYTVASGAAAAARVDITDNDGARIQIVATDAAAAEEAGNNAVFTVSRTGSRTSDLTVRYTVTGTATGGDDYAELPGELVIPAGSASATITLTPLDDLIGENPETVIIALVGSPGTIIVTSRKSARATIADNEPVVRIAATDASSAEAGPGTATYTVTRVGSSTAAIMVTYAVTGTATSGSDFVALSGSVIIAAGSLSATITLTPIDDAVAEGVENVIVTLTQDDGYRIDQARKRAVANIADNEPTVSVAASDASASENNNATGTFTFTRSGTPRGVLVARYTMSGAATAGVDYQTLSGEVTFADGQAAVTVLVTPINDSLGEGSEQVVLTLSNLPAYRRNPSKTVARVTITDNEPSVSIVATDGAAAESDGPPEEANTATFTVSRTGSTIGSITIPYTVTGNASHNGDDYIVLSGTVTIDDGQSRATIVVTPIDDAIAETAETVIVTISGNVGYLVSNSRKSATATIADNEPVVSVVASDATATEAGSGATAAGAFKVSRAVAGSSPLTVFYTIGGSATADADYEALTGSVTIAADETDAIITLTPMQDLIGEGDEHVEITLTNNGGYTVQSTSGRNKARVTIKDDEPVVRITATDNSATEQDETNAVFTITRTGTSDELQMELTVTYRVEGTAQSGDDFEPLDGEVTFAANETSVTIIVTAIDDLEGETNETVILTLENEDGLPFNIDPAKASATATITDNEPAVSITATDGAAGEFNNPGVLTVRRTGSTADSLTVTYTIAGTATNNVDYAELTGSVTFDAGSTSATITVAPIYDLLVESSEIVEVTLATPGAGAGYRVDANKTARVTIANAPPVDLNIQNVGYAARSYSLASTGIQSSFVTTFNNLGPAEGGNSGGFSVEFRFSLNNTWGDDDDIVIGSISTASVAGGASATITFTFDFDAVKSRLAAGSYHLGVRLDSAGRVTEQSKTNNTYFSMAADIVVTA